MKTAKVYSYLRFSDPKQAAGSSADRQIQYAERWAAERQLELDGSLTLRDEGLSAYHQRHVSRGALGAFLAAIDQGHIPHGSVLIVEGLDRLSRAEPILAQAQLTQIINAGITVVTASDGKEYNREKLKSNPMDLVYSLLVMIRAHEESDTKSKRVKAAIQRQIDGWINGTFRGRIVTGQDPQWLKWNGQKWEMIEDRAAAYHLAFKLYAQGLGARPILQQLSKEGMKLNNKGLPDPANFYRTLHNPAVYGDRVISLNGNSYTLEKYYPALIEKDDFLKLQSQVNERTKKGRPSGITNILTGMAILRCGYCGATIAGQAQTSKIKKDGTYNKELRRMLCINSGNIKIKECPHPGSTKASPVENAIMEFCSDKINLETLFDTSDRTAPLRQELKNAKASREKIKTQLEKITLALIESPPEATPKTFIKKASELETSLDATEKTIRQLEGELIQTSQSGEHIDIAEKWAELREGVKNFDEDSRKKARKMIMHTFKSIIIYMSGISPSHSEKGSRRWIDLVLIPKGGKVRTLRIERKTGKWLAAEDLQT
ncbi:recombinase family protein [Chromobacterium haemolyticum]|uniref:Resolvase/invertase-type recombinase catalytic domain-containing protein n=1 Tax=Chromobacterium haemolyticum TaxID=394935 RepID=A0A1W0CG56_9NEIS|nr:recombinase family protein [Chromobacterium haemolyticum]OQS33698.1 hypothetical protein B0T45_20095 [Chromobacterium haemolyticum]